jgi:hypothetical protein
MSASLAACDTHLLLSRSSRGRPFAVIADALDSLDAGMLALLEAATRVSPRTDEDNPRGLTGTG